MSKLVYDYDQFIDHQIIEKQSLFIQQIEGDVSELMLNGYKNGWSNQGAYVNLP